MIKSTIWHSPILHSLPLIAAAIKILPSTFPVLLLRGWVENSVLFGPNNWKRIRPWWSRALLIVHIQMTSIPCLLTPLLRNVPPRAFPNENPFHALQTLRPPFLLLRSSTFLLPMTFIPTMMSANSRLQPPKPLIPQLFPPGEEEIVTSSKNKIATSTLLHPKVQKQDRKPNMMLWQKMDRSRSCCVPLQEPPLISRIPKKILFELFWSIILSPGTLTVIIFSGCFSATSSISIPPSVEAIIEIEDEALSTSILR